MCFDLLVAFGKQLLIVAPGSQRLFEGEQVSRR
jgi:hypothetical protein